MPRNASTSPIRIERATLKRLHELLHQKVLPAGVSITPGQAANWAVNYMLGCLTDEKDGILTSVNRHIRRSLGHALQVILRDLLNDPALTVEVTADGTTVQISAAAKVNAGEQHFALDLPDMAPMWPTIQ